MDVNKTGINYNPTQIKNELNTIEGFSWGKALEAGKKALDTDDNTTRLMSVAKNWLSAQLQTFKGHILSDNEIKQQAQVEAALSTHPLSRIGTAFFEVLFGKDKLLVPCRNIAQRDTLRSREDRDSFEALKKTILENKDNLTPILGYDQSLLTEEGKAQLFSATSKSANQDGVCYSCCLYLIGKILQDPHMDEAKLIEIVKEVQKGVPGQVAAIQEIYHEAQFPAISSAALKDRNHAPQERTHIINSVLEAVSQKSAVSENIALELQKTTNELIDQLLMFQDHGSTFNIDRFFLLKLLTLPQQATRFQEAFQHVYGPISKNMSPEVRHALRQVNPTNILEYYKGNTIAHLYGYSQDFEGTGRALKVLGNYNNHPSTKEQLFDFHKLEPGAYHISTSILFGGHALLYLKLPGGDSYIVDPNYGLIKCDPENPAKALLQLLSLYPPPYDRLEKEKDDDRNYRLVFTKFTTTKPPFVS